MCKVFLQHLQALGARASFAALWARVLRVQRALLAAPQEPLREAALESLKNMLLVMHSVRIFNSGESYNDLWYITWEIISEFLPTLKDELFPDVIDNMKPVPNLPSHMQPPLPPTLPTLLPAAPPIPVPPSPTNVNQVVPKPQPPRQNILVASMQSPVVSQSASISPSIVAPVPLSSNAQAVPSAPAQPVSGMVPIRNQLYDQSGLTSSVLLQPLNEMISTPIGISIHSQPPMLYTRLAQPQNNVQTNPDQCQNDAKHVEIEPNGSQTKSDANESQQSELYAEYLSNPYNDSKEISLKETTLYDPDEKHRLSDSKDQTVPDQILETHPLVSQKSFSANATPMHSKNKAQFNSTENVRQESSIFNFSSYFGSANDLVIPGSEVFDTLMSTQEG